MLLAELSHLEQQKQELQASFRERGYAFHHQIDTPGRIWRNLFAEAEEIFVALTSGMSIGINGQFINLEPFEEFYIPAGKNYDIVGRCPDECQWMHAYDLAEVDVRSRLVRKSGLLSVDDYNFINEE
ncbi:hypothetical protein PsW64_04665 [Pseudovibrio sp. W64]|uniref:hypothetical protein n=1 Tax=unclassified Pseudovibrio TaxID=2627060 RepID=UPI0007B2585E|nr:MULTISPECIES: hypothetical protein [unclassified Pseudovibrio]KZK77484.1 hypothetical protein PsW64_04665 [Pseudovibrio sp. W64]KZK88187.1 hypothetical protein PsAD13_00135 [Pseudovibrio sp. Ad13]KZK96285.1 hypothetical protein PsAD46_00137 [Pseudovibrio sp. Ad46]KZL00902.1 hypothetical protein PsAD5_00743 [Pseudovibrio sp. Ad5]KZL16977.1 hypothetical protein PsAD26_00135 [Pseudovibrio sp. Ad26]